ncbi:MAG: PorV/PorQ family protein [Desulfocucumaceae bacterium]
MKSIKILAGFLVIIAPMLWAQEQEDIMLSPFWEFYSDNHLSLTAAGRGYAGVAETGDLTLANMNPASIAGSGNGWAAATVYKSRMTWFEDWIDLAPNVPSLFLGGCRQMGEAVTVGLIYSDCYSYIMDFGEMQVTGTSGEDLGTTEAYDKISISRISLPIAFRATPAFAVGLDLGGNWVHRKTSSFINNTVDLFTLVPKLGFIVGPVSGFSFGISATPQSSTKYDYQYEFWDISHIEHYTNIYPGRLTAGFKYQGLTTNYYFDLNYVNTGINDNQIDRRDFNLGVEHRRGIWVYRAGLFSVMDYRNPEIEWIDEVGHDNQYFLTAGIEKTDGRVKYAVSIMDSHLLSPGAFKTTKIQAGLKYSFKNN